MDNSTENISILILYYQCRVKDAHKISRWKLSLIKIYDNFKNWKLNLSNISNDLYISFKIVLLSNRDV